MVRWHHQLSGRVFEQSPGDSEGQGSLVCCIPWGCEESDMTEQLNNKRYFLVTPNQGWEFCFPLLFVVQSPSRVYLFVTPWTAAHQASLSFTISQSLLKLVSIELVIPSNHLILCCPLLLLPSIFPSIRIFSW